MTGRRSSKETTSSMAVTSIPGFTTAECSPHSAHAQAPSGSASLPAFVNRRLKPFSIRPALDDSIPKLWAQRCPAQVTNLNRPLESSDRASNSSNYQANPIQAFNPFKYSTSIMFSLFVRVHRYMGVLCCHPDSGNIWARGPGLGLLQRVRHRRSENLER